jgi:hypothetical protein
LYNAVSQVEHGVGVMFLIATPERAVTAPMSVSAVLLDGVQDPGNVGSILRSAAAAGITQVYCSAGTAFCWSPKVLRAAMGAHFVLDIFENVDLAALVSAAQGGDAGDQRLRHPAPVRCRPAPAGGVAVWPRRAGRGRRFIVDGDPSGCDSPPRSGRVVKRCRLCSSMLF